MTESWCSHSTCSTCPIPICSGLVRPAQPLDRDRGVGVTENWKSRWPWCLSVQTCLLLRPTRLSAALVPGMLMAGPTNGSGPPDPMQCVAYSAVRRRVIVVITGRQTELQARRVPPGAAGAATGPASGQWQISTAGGIYPLWRPDGKELYFLNPAGAMMAAPIIVNGSTLAPGASVVPFPTRIWAVAWKRNRGGCTTSRPMGASRSTRCWTRRPRRSRCS